MVLGKSLKIRGGNVLYLALSFDEVKYVRNVIQYDAIPRVKLAAPWNSIQRTMSAVSRPDSNSYGMPLRKIRSVGNPVTANSARRPVHEESVHVSE